MRIQSFGVLPIPMAVEGGGAGGGGVGNSPAPGLDPSNGNQPIDNYIDNILPEFGADSAGDGEISVDPLDSLRDLYQQEPPVDGADPAADASQVNGNQPAPGRTAEQVTQQVQQALGAISLPENIIPDNFDSSDPRQLRALLTTVAKHSVQSALGIMFTPIQHAMEAQMLEVNNRIQSTITATMDGDRRNRSLREAIPIYDNAEIRPMVDMLYGQAMIRHKKDQSTAIASVKKTLQSMGIDWQGSAPAGGSGRNGEQAVRRGANALDSFAPLPALGGNGNRVGNRLTR